MEEGREGKKQPEYPITGDQMVHWDIALRLREGCGDLGSNPDSPLSS